MSKSLSIAGIAIGVLGLVPWVLDMAGIGTSGALAPYLPALLDVWRVVSPFALIFGGGVAGWIVRDRSKTSDAVAAARIEMEKAEHEEKMRRDREEYEAKKRAEEEEAEAEAWEELHKEGMVSAFRHADPSVKQHVFQMLEEGSIEMRLEVFRMMGLSEWADYTTIDASWSSYDPTISAYLLDETREMLEENRYLVDEFRGNG